MDVLIKLALERGFDRIHSNYSGCAVFHCVPGAGKTTLIRDLLQRDSRFQALTFGVVDKQSLSGRRIKGPSERLEEGKLTIVDEYTEGDWEIYKPIALFGDPIQSCNLSRVKPSNFECRRTFRFGRQTCALLGRLGFHITSEFDDEVIIGDVFSIEPEGLIIAFEPEVKELLEDHGCDYSEPCALRGRTTKAVTFITASESIPESLAHLFFIALTRHQEKLIVLSRNATFGAT
ncbi:triple gene block protein 1 [Elderberry carlavirus A]|uniref:triple gene block protein 1 n=1 Tax=Elderberry carlavirus A TaxID=1569052 RepID=UPI00054A80B6|nr:triple gene block protein 1 [Elderberry carlavirus A]AIZ76614.1 triple gene block protein 1 [Elderberry carlavirus A]